MRVVAVIAGCALLAACAGLPAPDTQPVAPPAGENFELTGRLSVKYEDKGFSGALRWKHEGSRDDLALASPLGQTLAQVVSDADGARLTTSENKLYRAASVERLAREALGWELPLAGLRYWVLGKTIPGVAVNSPERDSHNRLTGFVQDAWQVRVTDYLPVERGSSPARMQMGYGSVEIRLVIDDIKTQ